MKRIYWILTSISLYSLLSCSNGAKDTREYQTVKTDTVVSAGGQTSLQYPGKVKAAQDISLAFRVSGTIQKIYVKDGARVQAGQLLAELDPTDYQVQLDATEAEYDAEVARLSGMYLMPEEKVRPLLAHREGIKIQQDIAISKAADWVAAQVRQQTAATS